MTFHICFQTYSLLRERKYSEVITMVHSIYMLKVHIPERPKSKVGKLMTTYLLKTGIKQDA